MFYVSQKYLKYSSIFLLVWYKSQLTLKQEDVELSIFFLCSHPQRRSHCFDQNVSHCQLSILAIPFLLLSCFHFLAHNQPNFWCCLIVPEVETHFEIFNISLNCLYIVVLIWFQSDTKLGNNKNVIEVHFWTINLQVKPPSQTSKSNILVEPPCKTSKSNLPTSKSNLQVNPLLLGAK